VDSSRFNDLYSTYARRIYNYVLWMTRNREATEDIVQSLFMKIWGRPSLPRQQREVEAWMYAVARNQCMDFFRKCSRMTRLRVQYARETPLYGDERIENRIAWESLGGLSDEERSLLYLHLRAGYSYREIAEILDSNENAVRVRAFRALAKLRKRYIKENL
jgi:RNA polymerase sigma-70 factor (ECF subfamily)